MDKDQITALAREYAEWITSDYGKDNAYIPGTQATTAIFLRWLQRRYYLVEKSKMEEEYKKTCESVNKHSATTGCLFFVGQKQTLETLFPEIAKEVER